MTQQEFHWLVTGLLMTILMHINEFLPLKLLWFIAAAGCFRNWWNEPSVYELEEDE